MMDAGIATICTLTNIAGDGDMPVYKLVEVSKAYFAQRTISYRRLYAAKGANERIDLLIRMWRDPAVQSGQYVVLSESVTDGQYEIETVQHTVDEDNLQVTDVALRRVDKLYEVIAGDAKKHTGCAECNFSG